MKLLIVFVLLLFSFPIVAAKGIDCFSMYHFSDSYFRTLWTDKTVYNPGDNSTINVQLENTNTYPMPNLNIRAYVFYIGPTFQDRTEGNDLVDDFWVARDVNILPGSISNASYVWSIPDNAKSGTYLVSLYLNSVDQFNLGGLSFYPEVAGKIFMFDVKNPSNGSRIYFDKNSVFVNDQPYHFRSPLDSYTLPQTVKVNLVNDGPDSPISVNYKIYSWDDSTESNVVKKSSDNFSLSQGQSKQLSYTIPNLSPNVYQLVLTALSGDGRKSILKVRLPVDTQNGRFVYLGLDKFPIQKGENINIFWCYSNSAYSSYEGKQTIEIKDFSNNSVYKSELPQINFTGPVLGQEINFSSPQNMRKLMLIGRIYDLNGKLQKEVVIPYNADKFGLAAPQEETPSGLSFNYLLLIPVVIVVLIFVILFILWRRK